jgi:hypothetical protein
MVIPYFFRYRLAGYYRLSDTTPTIFAVECHLIGFRLVRFRISDIGVLK